MANLVAVALFVLALFLAATWPEHYDPASSPNKPVVSFDALKGFDPEAELAPEKTRLVDQSLINAVTNTVTSFVGSDTMTVIYTSIGQMMTATARTSGEP